MKIGILTHQLHSNYGGILQNFALQKVLTNMGHDVKTIDYVKNLSCSVKFLSLIKRLFLNIFGKSFLPIRGWTYRVEDESITQYTRKFVSHNIKTTKRVSITRIKQFNKDFDAVIVGSDQVWRYQYLGSYIKEFFLSSFSNVPIKIAYAASFGTDVWEMPNSMTKTCRKLVKKFKGVSVREKSGLKLCKEFLDVDSLHVLDPTMLLSVADYIFLIRNANELCLNGNLMTYILDKSTEKKQIIEFVSNKLLLTPIEVISDKTFSEVGSKGIEQCIVPPIERWLRGFWDAEFVVTDSFHGTVFSIIFNKPFLVIGNEKRGLSRMQSLLLEFDLEDRLITTFDEVESRLFSPINWSRVNLLWNERKEYSLSYINRMLKQ